MKPSGHKHHASAIETPLRGEMSLHSLNRNQAALTTEEEVSLLFMSQKLFH